MEYHWLNWPKVQDGKHRYCIPEKGVIFTDEYIENQQFSEHNGFFEVNASILSPEEKTSMFSRVEQWEKHGRKWRYIDKALQTEDFKQVVFPEISVISHQEMLDNVGFVVWGKDSRKTFFGLSDIDEILRSHFNLAEQVSIYTGKKYDEKINIPKPSPPPTPLEIETRERQGFLGFIVEREVDDETGEVTYYDTDEPLYYDLDKQGPNHTMIVGITGSAKTTSVAFPIIESVLDANIPVVVLTPRDEQWTGFFAPCKNPYLLSLYPKFGMKTPKETNFKGYTGKIYTPSADYGLPINANLLAKPNTIKEEEVSAFVDEVMTLIEKICPKLGASSLDVRQKIFDTWWDDKEDLDYKSLQDSFPDKKEIKNDEEKITVNKTRIVLNPLTSFKFLFEKGKGHFSFEPIMKEGGIHIISLVNISTNDAVKMFLVHYLSKRLIDYFKDKGQSDKELQMMFVVEETPEFTGLAVTALESLAKTVRKRGVGLLFLAQGITELTVPMRNNSNTKIFMRNFFPDDVDRAKKTIKELADGLPDLDDAEGIVFNTKMKLRARVKFRPCRVSDEELDQDEIKQLMQKYKS